jgi:hypothetical protein
MPWLLALDTMALRHLTRVDIKDGWSQQKQRLSPPIISLSSLF